MTATLVIAATLGVPAIGSAQYRHRGDSRQSVVVQCGPGQRAVMSRQRNYGRSRTVVRCVRSSRRMAGNGYGRRIQTRGYNSYRYNSYRYDPYRPARSRYDERRP